MERARHRAGYDTHHKDGDGDKEGHFSFTSVHAGYVHHCRQGKNAIWSIRRGRGEEREQSIGLRYSLFFGWNDNYFALVSSSSTFFVDDVSDERRDD